LHRTWHQDFFVYSVSLSTGCKILTSLTMCVAEVG